MCKNITIEIKTAVANFWSEKTSDFLFYHLVRMYRKQVFNLGYLIVTSVAV